MRTRVIHDISEWRAVRESASFHGKTVGLVPTMGALHEGHAALFKRARTENDIVVGTIFVNPTQFNDPKDLEKYPRTFDEDVRILNWAGVDFLLSPQFAEIYPDGYRYKVSENDLSLSLCGARRPGHFDGVLTVVMKLFNLVDADRAYFGEKDFQQLQLIKGMTDAFFLKTEIVPCATVREEDGLAMSSRNRLLAKTERALAPRFPAILGAGDSVEITRRKLNDAGFEVDYVEERNGRRFGAVKIGDVRLIDNLQIEETIP